MNLAVAEGKIVGMPRVFSVSDGAEKVALFRLDADDQFDIPPVFRKAFLESNADL